MLKKRLASCREALLLGEKISEVYTNYGFRDYPGFFRAFKKEYGLSPQEYRKLYAVRNYSMDVSDNKKP
jgi:AraC-like DNA-binding protein